MGVDLSRSTPAAGGGSMLDRIGSESGGLGAALGQGFSGLIGGIGNALRGIFTPGGLFAPVGEAAQEIRDGQLDLESRTDLLSPLLDSGTCFFPAESSMTGNGLVPLTKQLGPVRNVELLRTQGGGFKFLDVGFWTIDVQITVDNSWGEVLIGSGVFEVTIQVFRPNGSLFSEQAGRLSHINPTTMTLVSSVVVENPGSYVKVRLSRMHSARKVLGGPKWSRMTVQHLSREVNGNWAKGNENSETPSA